MRIRVQGKSWFETNECKQAEVWKDNDLRTLYMTQSGKFILCKSETENPELITKEDALPLVVDAVNSSCPVDPEIQELFQQDIDSAWPEENKI